MADGMNGQLLGSVMIWSAFIIYYLGVDVGVPFIVLICSALVTFIYNLRGRLFAGNSGAYAKHPSLWRWAPLRLIAFPTERCRPKCPCFGFGFPYWTACA